MYRKRIWQRRPKPAEWHPVVKTLLTDGAGIPCYDKVLLKQAAIDSGLTESLFENADERRNSWIWNAFCMGNPTADTMMTAATDYLTNDSLFYMQSRTIKKLAFEGSCIFIGRCAESGKS